MLRTHTLIWIGCGLTSALHPSSTLGQSVPTGFGIEAVVLEPFAAQPVAFAFLPDGRVLVTEKDTGSVRLATMTSTASVVIATVPDVTNEIEQGLLGIAVDPGWPARPYVYVLASHTGARLHVTRYTASGDLEDAASTNLSLAQPFTILDDLPDFAAHHNGGTLRFGPDANLYVSLGDDGNACEAQDPSRLQGKILRLDVSGLPSSGTGPPAKALITPSDNPFQGSDDNARLVFAYGLRNPFRFTIDSPTGNLYIGDVGLMAWEEVDELVFGTDDGANFGWPAFEGPLPDPCCAECVATPPFVAPIYAYTNPPDPLAASVVAGPVYRGRIGSPASFPAEYEGMLFIADFFGRWIRRLERTAQGWQVAAPVPGQPNTTDWALELGKPSDLQIGPDGALYCLIWPRTTLPRGLWRIVNTLPIDAVEPGEIAPVLASPNPAPAGAEIAFRLSAQTAGAATLLLFDVAGHLERTLPVPAGARLVRWNGRFANGRVASSGVYFYEVRLEDRRFARGRFTILR